MFSIVLGVALVLFALAFSLCVAANHAQISATDHLELARYRACTRACATPPHLPHAPVTRQKAPGRTKRAKRVSSPLTRVSWGRWML